MPARVRRSSRGNRDVDTAAHKRTRKAALAVLARSPGQPCARCGQPMYAWQKLDLDHTDDRRGYLGLSHASCNRRAGQAITASILRARGAALTPRQLAAIRLKQWQASQANASGRRAREW
jgi:hypothetical protein